MHRLSGFLQHRAWIMVGTATAILALVATMVTMSLDDDSEAKVSVAAVSFGDVIKLVAERTNFGGAEVAEVGVTPVDIAMKNGGGAALTVAEIVGEVRTFENLTNCWSAGAGATEVSAEYSLRIPTDERGHPSATTVTTTTDFTIKPDSTDRMVVTVGADKVGVGVLQLIEITLRLKTAEGVELPVGTIATAQPHDQVESHLAQLARGRGSMAGYEHMILPCVEKQAGYFSQLSSDAKVTKGVENLKAAYQGF